MMGDKYKHQETISQEILKENLHYNPDTGVFTWIKRGSRRIFMSEAGVINLHGYRQIGLFGKIYKAHRLAWLYMEGYFPEQDIDHIDRDRSNNRFSNLREASRVCNMRNRPRLSNNTSGVTGVRQTACGKTWSSWVTVNKKQLRLGTFGNFVDAVKARWNGEVKYGFPNCRSDSDAYLYLKENNHI